MNIPLVPKVLAYTLGIYFIFVFILVIPNGYFRKDEPLTVSYYLIFPALLFCIWYTYSYIKLFPKKKKK